VELSLHCPNRFSWHDPETSKTEKFALDSTSETFLYQDTELKPWTPTEAILEERRALNRQSLFETGGMKSDVHWQIK